MWRGRRELAELYPGLTPEEIEQFGLVPEEFEFSSVSSGLWKPEEFARAYLAASRVLREVGFLRGAAHWVFADAAGDWWALPDWGELVGPSTNLGAPACWYVDPTGDGADDLPDGFYRELGGEYGPVTWAWHIVQQVGELRRKRALVAQRAARVRSLLALPEWAAMVRAVDSSGDWQLRAGIDQLQHLAAGGEWGRQLDGLAEGYALGAGFGFLEAVDGVRFHEEKRNPGKVELRAALLEIAREVAAVGPLQPYTLAGALIRERDAKTERGQRLAALGLADNAVRLGALIAEIAKKAGLLPP